MTASLALWYGVRLESGRSRVRIPLASDLKIGTPVATLRGAWLYRVSTGTGRPGVSILWLGEVERLSCNFCLSVYLRYTVACCWDVKQPTNKQALEHVLTHPFNLYLERFAQVHRNFMGCAGLDKRLTAAVFIPCSSRHRFYSRMPKGIEGLLLLVGCLTSQQHASVSQGRICSDHFTCCHTEIEVTDPTFHLTQSQYTDTGSTSPSAEPITPGDWQGSHWSANF